MGAIKVLIVDDSALVRQTFRTLLEMDSEIEVIGTASDPYVAVQKIQKEKPDVITLDIEMPRMDGLTFLKKIMNQAPMPVVVISNQTVKGADVAMKALEIGAVDVMTKPALSSAQNIADSGIELIDKVRSAYFAKRSSGVRPATSLIRESIAFAPRKISHNAVIAVGSSTGGVDAIKTLLEGFPESMPPILVVQHMPEKFTASFAERLNSISSLKVKEAEDDDPVLPNTVYIAKGGHHMVLKRINGQYVIRIFMGELVNRHRPSVNVLFDSVAEAAGKNAVGVILTGMGDDGASGLLAMHQKGAYTIAQDEATSVVFGMPHRAILLGGVSKVLPLQDISREIYDRVHSVEHVKSV